MTAKDLNVSLPASKTYVAPQMSNSINSYIHSWSNLPLDAEGQDIDLSVEGMLKKRGGVSYFKTSKVSHKELINEEGGISLKSLNREQVLTLWQVGKIQIAKA